MSMPPTHESYLHKTVSRVGVEVERRVLLYSFGEGGVRRHHSAFNVCAWVAWKSAAYVLVLQKGTIAEVHLSSWYLVSTHRGVC